MKKLLTFPIVKPTIGEKINNILGAYGFLILWFVVIKFIYSLLGQEFGGGEEIEVPLWQFFLVCIIAPIWEEAVYRYLPISLCKLSSKSEEIIFPVVIALSCYFGFIHYGAASIAVQGVTGFVLFTVFIRNGSSYWSAVVLHSLINTSLMFLLPYLIK